MCVKNGETYQMISGIRNMHSNGQVVADTLGSISSCPWRANLQRINWLKPSPLATGGYGLLACCIPAVDTASYGAGRLREPGGEFTGELLYEATQ